MGEKYIAIQPGNSTTFLQEGDTIQGMATGDVTKIAADAQPIILNLKKIVRQLNKVLMTLPNKIFGKHYIMFNSSPKISIVL